MGKIDAAYRRLFQHKELLRDLLACVLSPSLFDTLDWERMRSVPTRHVSDTLKQRDGDCAWLIPRKERLRQTLDQVSKPVSSHEGNPSPLAPSQGLCILLLLEPQPGAQPRC